MEKLSEGTLYRRPPAHPGQYRPRPLALALRQVSQKKYDSPFYSASVSSIINMLLCYCAAGGRGSVPRPAERANAH